MRKVLKGINIVIILSLISIAAGVAFTASHFPSFDIITASFASPKDDVRKTDPLDVANSPKLSAFLLKL